ncbi:glycosyltransferase family 9 protein [Chitinilyticum litopenaei]|uniref:glycosyltransferase family 9 protein n=1 Tax=Chitinilyticum litopenaei TaxID=1121276 RepID=UPI0009DBBA2E|nr:glycosyltransferase family 9 protein [Chitinilyticum litopenaei]
MKILLIRRDNIGDLVCTTPLFEAIKKHYPSAICHLFANSYNAPLIENHPFIDRVFIYSKAKHRASGESSLGIYWQRLRQIWMLRREKYDVAILAGRSGIARMARTARMIGCKNIIGFDLHGDNRDNLDQPIAVPAIPEHEACCNFRLLAPLKISGTPPAAMILPNPSSRDHAQSALLAACAGKAPSDAKLIALHISARKSSQRWPEEHFIELAHLLATSGKRLLLLWSPGEEDNPLHPGDDNKAARIMAKCSGLPILAYPTHALPELIAALSLADQVVCSDGGAMHIAAALGKPIVCFFGQSDATVWHPWGVAYKLLQPASLDVRDVSCISVLAALDELSQDERILPA